MKAWVYRPRLSVVCVCPRTLAVRYSEQASQVDVEALAAFGGLLFNEPCH